MVVANRILDDEKLANMAYSIRFDVLDSSLNIIGTPGPLAASSVSLNVSSKTLRTISGVKLTQNDMAAINPFTDRLRPTMVLGDATEWPLGVFVFSDQTDWLTDGVGKSDLTLADLSAVIDQLCVTDVSYAIGTPVIPAIESILNMLGVSNTFILGPPDFTTVVSAAVTWPAGTSYLTIVSQLASLGGYFPPYFNNNGYCVIRRPQQIFVADADIFYQSSGTTKVAADTAKVNSGTLTAPNTYLVIDTAPKAGPVAAVAFVESYLPWSKENRGGYRVTEVVRTQGLGATTEAQAMADSLAVASQGFETVNFSSRPDPRHDGFQLIGWNGIIYRELSWSMPLTVGGLQTHSLVRGGFPAVTAQVTTT